MNTPDKNHEGPTSLKGIATDQQHGPESKHKVVADTLPAGVRTDSGELPTELASEAETPIGFKCPPPHLVPADDSTVWGASLSFWNDVEKLVADEPSPIAVQRLAVELTRALTAPELLFFDGFKTDPAERFIAVPESSNLPDVWVIGDLHGDLLGLLTAIHYIRAAGTSHSVVVFLGDLFDRGKYERGVLYEVLRLIVEAPGRYGFIVGNHDEGLRQADNGSFTSSVEPCEFVEWLNKEPEESAWRDLAKAAISFFERAPRAVLLPDGLLLAHGGVPHIDKQRSIHSISDLNLQPILDDFVWTRLHESAKRRIPNRTTRGCSLGISDFDAFCECVGNVLKRPIRGMLRGHDHLEARFQFFDKYRDHPVLTINTICYRQAGEFFGEFHRPAIVAEYRSGSMPVVHKLELPADLIERVYGNHIAPSE